MDATTHPAPRAPAALSHAETRVIVWGMLLPVFMSSLDQTILASALPTIGHDLGDVHSLPWLVTAFLIASAAVTPLYGKVSDIHGRRLTVLIALSTYMVGSIVCLAATNMLTLICGRVLHGLGGGGMASLGMVVLGDLYDGRCLRPGARRLHRAEPALEGDLRPRPRHGCHRVDAELAAAAPAAAL